MSADLSIAEARRIALAAQGFDRARPSRAGLPQLRAVMQKLGVVQIDSVNVLAQAHYVVPYSRLGPYDRRDFERLVYERREFTEQWAHEAAIIPIATWPLLRHRMDTHRVRPYFFDAFLKENVAYSELILDHVRTRGPLSADQLPPPEGHGRRLQDSWIGTIPRAVLEAHFGRGLLAVAGRRTNMARIFDLAERVVAGKHHGRVLEREYEQRELIRLASRAHGIGTAADLGDYYRLNIGDARRRVAELASAGELREVRVEGWREPAYLHPQARLPRSIEAAALLSPFDPVVWFRPRAQRLFDFEYRIEIYTPAKKRRWGYYVLPFLLNDRLVARVDLKADRAAGRLLVFSAHLEPSFDAQKVAAS
ncbi:MAG: crosslink repair DNA glycosylase YcaQ family protein, partial [Bryobacteraceae bacterium]